MVYNAGLPNSSQDLFSKTTKHIAEYVAKSYKNAGEFCLGLINGELPKLDPPDEPQDPNSLLEVEMFKT